MSFHGHGHGHGRGRSRSSSSSSSSGRRRNPNKHKGGNQGYYPNQNQNQNQGFHPNQGYNNNMGMNMGMNMGTGMGMGMSMGTGIGMGVGIGMNSDRDQQLRNSIDQIFYKYDRDNSGFLDEKQFTASIGQLCNMMGRPQPTSYNEFIQIAKSVDSNYDGRISKIELFNVFKRYSGY